MENFLEYNRLVNKITKNQKTYHLCNQSKTVCSENVGRVTDDQVIHIESQDANGFINICLGNTYLYLKTFNKIISVLTPKAYSYNTYLRLLLASLHSSKEIDVCGNCARKLYKFEEE